MTIMIKPNLVKQTLIDYIERAEGGCFDRNVLKRLVKEYITSITSVSGIEEDRACWDRLDLESLVEELVHDNVKVEANNSSTVEANNTAVEADDNEVSTLLV